MISNLFEFRLLTPRESILDAPVHMAVIPGVEGYFGILKAHIEMVSLIKPGILELSMGQNSVKKYIVSYGICRIDSTGCDLIVEDVVALHDLDKESVQADIENCEKTLTEITSLTRKKRLEQRLEFLQLCMTTGK